jgi:hypothetical protein
MFSSVFLAILFGVGCAFDVIRSIGGESDARWEFNVMDINEWLV